MHKNEVPSRLLYEYIALFNEIAITTHQMLNIWRRSVALILKGELPLPYTGKVHGILRNHKRLQFYINIASNIPLSLPVGGATIWVKLVQLFSNWILCLINLPTFGTFFIQVDAPSETIRYCGFEWWNNCVQCWFPKWFWMVGQLIQNLV